MRWSLLLVLGLLGSGYASREAPACDIVIRSVVAQSQAAGTHPRYAVIVPHVQVLSVPTIATCALVQPLLVRQHVVQQTIVRQHCAGAQRLGIFDRPRVRTLSITRAVVR